MANQISHSTRRYADQGFGASGILLLFGGIAVSWFIFLFIMDAIRDNHQAKVKERMDRFDSYKKSNSIDYSRRGAKGYRLNR